MKFLSTRFEVLVSIGFLFIVEAIFWPPVSYFTKTTVAFDASDPVNLVAHSGLLAFLAIVIVVRREQMLAALRAAWLVVLLAVLAYLSAFWSAAPDLVFRRATTLSITTLFAIYLAVRFEMGELVAILVKVNAFAAVSSLVVLAVAPRLGSGASMEYPEAIRGAYLDKNTLGAMSAAGIIIAFYAWRVGYGSRLIAAALIPADILLLYVSQSATAIIITLAAAYVAVAAGAFRRRDALGFTAGAALIVAGLAAIGLLAIGWSEILTALHRSPTMTGRTPIWQLSVHFIEQHPWLGYGFGSFWRHDALEARTYWTLLHWPVPHAHNAWLEIGLALGGLGMVGITVLWVTAFYRAARLLGAATARHVVFCLAMLAAILVENLTEYEFLRPDSFFWVFFVTVFVYLGREAAALRDAQAAARPWPVPLRAASVAIPQARRT
jgi:exopolysaccharide production protein ExoQ